MGWDLLVAVVLLTASSLVSSDAIGDFKRMPDIRGQSFGLENFLRQPFDLASQAQDSQETAPYRPSSKRRPHHQPTQDSYSVEFQVHNDEFDMRRIVPTLPGASMLFNQAETDGSYDFKPVHEEIVESPPPSRSRQPANDNQPGRQVRRKPAFENKQEYPTPTRQAPSFDVESQSSAPKKKMPSLEEELESLTPVKEFPSFEEEVQSILPKRRLPPPETRRPLEKPAEFIVSLTEHVEPFPSPLDEVRPERHRKRVMKRRRKKPASPPLQMPQEEKLTVEADPIKEIEDNLFHSMPTSYQQTVKDATEAESIVIQHGPRRAAGYRRREPVQSIFGEEEDNVEGASQHQDKLLKQDAQKEIIESSLAGRPNALTTENPGESTQRLRTLLKQQNGQLSLSELLQTQNLSLADFLQGNPGALSALGGVIKSDDSIQSDYGPTTEKIKNESKPHIPKISSKSRPFSKPLNGTKSFRRSTTTTTTSTTTSTTLATTIEQTTEEPVKGLPKKLQIIEVTSDKPIYNFIPKRPRLRIGQKTDKFNFSREKIEEASAERTSTTERISEEKLIESSFNEDRQENEFQINRTTIRNSGLKTTHEQETAIEQRNTPKRYGDYRPKGKIDRRKPSVDSTTDATTIIEARETTMMSTTEKVKNNKESRNSVRIPFMSVNNPEISVILPSKKPITTTEKPRSSPVIKDRINVFKRLNSEEKVTNGNTESESGIVTSTKHEATTMPTASPKSTTTDKEITGIESSDEIVELLKTGTNAQRLQRILAARNMTVSELVEKRANSSRQPNVTHLFEKSTETQLSGSHKVSELADNHYPSTERARAAHTTKRIMPVFDILSPNYKTDPTDKIRVKSEVVKSPETNAYDELFVDESVVRPIRLPIAEDNREPKSYQVPPKNVKQSSHTSLAPGIEGKAKQPIPLWNMNERGAFSDIPYSFPTYDLNNNLAGRPTTEPPRAIEDDIILLETVRNDDSHSRLKSSIDDILKEQIEIKEPKEDIAIIPPAVKSAIIASGVVMGIALIVFVAIFAACGWKQRQFRLRARSSILNDSIDGSARKAIRRTGTLSPVSFKRSALYKKSIDFDTESSVSGSSNTSSYLWNTLKHTFQSRNSTLKNREEKEEKINERENRSRRNTLCREERPRRQSPPREDSRHLSTTTPRNSMSREELRRDSLMSRDTLSRDHGRDSIISRDTLSRDLVRNESRRSNCFRDERRLNSLMRDNERCSFKTIDPERQIIQTSVNFKRGGFNGGSSRHFDTCDHFN